MQTKFDVPINSTVVETLTDGQLDLVKMTDWVYGKKPPTTWDDAARRAVFQIFNHSFSTWDRLSDVREYLDYLIDEIGPESKKEISGNVAAEYWAILGRTAAVVAEKKEIFKEIDAELAGHVDRIAEILVRKQRDYGHHNIARFGRAGLLVRMHDKVARRRAFFGADGGQFAHQSGALLRLGHAHGRTFGPVGAFHAQDQALGHACAE